MNLNFYRSKAFKARGKTLQERLQVQFNHWNHVAKACEDAIINAPLYTVYRKAYGRAHNHVCTLLHIQTLQDPSMSSEAILGVLNRWIESIKSDMEVELYEHDGEWDAMSFILVELECLVTLDEVESLAQKVESLVQSKNSSS